MLHHLTCAHKSRDHGLEVKEIGLLSQEVTLKVCKVFLLQCLIERRRIFLLTEMKAVMIFTGTFIISKLLL